MTRIASALLVTPRWTRNGGVAAHAMASAAALQESGVEVAVLTARSDGPVAGERVILAPGLFDRTLPPEQRVGEAASANYDVVHFHQAEHPEIAAYLRERGALLVSAHAYTACPSGFHYFRPGQECDRAHGPGCVPNMLVRGCAHGRRPTAFRSMYERSGRGLQTLRLADIAVSYSTAIERHLVRNGIARHALVPLFATLAPADVPAVPGRVLYAGRLVAAKGVATLLRAAAEVDCELVICGEGRDREALESLAAQLAIAGRTRFAGWLDGPALAREIGAAQVVAVPSLWPEPFGLVGIEAQAAGRAVVASMTGGVGDWLEPDETGVAVRPGDVAALAAALGRLVGDEDLCARLGSAGRRMVEQRFTAQTHSSALIDAYAAAVAARAA